LSLGLLLSRINNIMGISKNQVFYYLKNDKT